MVDGDNFIENDGEMVKSIPFDSILLSSSCEVHSTIKNQANSSITIKTFSPAFDSLIFYKISFNSNQIIAIMILKIPTNCNKRGSFVSVGLHVIEILWRDKRTYLLVVFWIISWIGDFVVIGPAWNTF